MAKIAVLFFTLVITIIKASPEANPEFAKAVESCIMENNVEPENIKKIIMGQNVDESVTSQKPVRCTFKCINLKSGLVNEAGEPNLEKMKAMFKLSDEDLEGHKKCYAEVTETDMCDKVFLAQSCIIKYHASKH